jgi:hypothetical protein
MVHDALKYIRKVIDSTAYRRARLEIKFATQVNTM